jgi:trigger factor
MTDEPRPEEPGTESGTPVAESTAAVVETPEAPEGEAEAQEKKEDNKLHQTVDMEDVGPCRKHIKVTIERKDIDKRLHEQFSKLMPQANVPGFRPGKAPRKVVERLFAKDVTDQVKGEIIIASLQQMAEENDVAALSPPDLDPRKIDLPKDGPMVYEFEVEVRPEFELPNYHGLRLKRPVHTFSDAEINREERRLLSRYAQVVPKPEGNAQEGDVLIADVTTHAGSRKLNEIKEFAVQIEPRVAFKDGLADQFADQVKGANPGDTRLVSIQLSSAVADPSLRGQTVTATVEVKDVKTLRMPELTHEFLHHFGVHSPEQFRELIHVMLQRRLEHLQRQSARQQVIQQIVATADWELPEDLLVRQARQALARRIMEMRADGISEEEIAARRRELEQDIVHSTEQSLKEHFVLQKIAEVEKIDVSDDDIDLEIERIAHQTDDSPRRVRARLEKDEMMNALAAELVERRVLDIILDSAEYEEVPLEGREASPVATVETQTVPGELQDPTAPPPPPEGSAEAPARGEAEKQPPNP